MAKFELTSLLNHSAMTTKTGANFALMDAKNVTILTREIIGSRPVQMREPVVGVFQANIEMDQHKTRVSNAIPVIMHSVRILKGSGSGETHIVILVLEVHQHLLVIQLIR
tara:strand:- start:252 stop:581 length:330 start_codon:yes stop_codon:yes gene_type:complete